MSLWSACVCRAATKRAACLAAGDMLPGHMAGMGMGIGPLFGWPNPQLQAPQVRRLWLWITGSVLALHSWMHHSCCGCCCRLPPRHNIDRDASCDMPACIQVACWQLQSQNLKRYVLPQAIDPAIQVMGDDSSSSDDEGSEDEGQAGGQAGAVLGQQQQEQAGQAGAGGAGAAGGLLPVTAEQHAQIMMQLQLQQQQELMMMQQHQMAMLMPPLVDDDDELELEEEGMYGAGQPGYMPLFMGPQGQGFAQLAGGPLGAGGLQGAGEPPGLYR
jgi:hypothetical protein